MRRWIPLLLVLSVFAARSAAAQAPGSPVNTGCSNSLPPVVILAEPLNDPSNESVVFGFPPGCEVFAGFVVLYEDPTKDPRNPQNWSDVIAFYQPGALPQPGSPATIVVMASDPQENGLTDADLGAEGVPFPTTFIQSQPTTVYIRENPLGPDNPYLAPSPVGQIQYNFVSDPPEPPTPAGNASWGKVKNIYR